MWIFLNNAFLSIVSAVDRPYDLLVRASRAGDIERVFPRVRVSVTLKSVYRFRAFVSRARVTRAIASQVSGINYTNFKDSVHDVDRHMAYLNVWGQIAYWQNVNGGEVPACDGVAGSSGRQTMRRH
jgi:hypothetical protein